MKNLNLKLKTIPFTLAPPQMKYLGMKLTKSVLSLVKEIKEQNKWRDIPCSWVGRLTIVKMSVLSNLSHRFSAIPASYFVAIVTKPGSFCRTHSKPKR